MKRISSKIFISILACTVIISSGIGILALMQTSEIITTETTEKIGYMAESYASQFDKRFSDVGTSLENLEGYVVATFKHDQLQKNPAYLYEYKEEIRDVIKNCVENASGVISTYIYFNPELTGEPNDIWYMKKDDKSKAVRQPEIKDKDYFIPENKQATWFFQPIREGKMVTTDPYRAPLANNSIIISYTKAVYKEGILIGVIGYDFLFEDIQNALQDIRVYKTGYATLMNTKKQFIVHPVLKNHEILDELKDGKYKEIKYELQRENSSVIKYTWIDGTEKIVGFSEMSNGWVLGITAPLKEAYSEIESLRSKMVFILALGIVISFLLAFIIGKIISEPIHRLTDYMSSVAQGNLDFKILSKSKDEIGMACNNFDKMVEALKSAGNEVAIYTNDLIAKNAELERFTYTVSHDLKSPIITIKGFASLIGKDMDNGRYDRAKNDLERIGNAADKMAELLEGLLELSRIGRMANPSELIPMPELANQVVELLHESISFKGIDVHIQENMTAVFGDRHRIQEILQNLLENAVKFMDKVNGKIEIGFYRQDNENIYFVRDNGPGIDPQYHDKIFGIFEKLDNNKGGSGIGLALVKRIIEYHGGRIWLESKVGFGTTFFFTINTENNEAVL